MICPKCNMNIKDDAKFCIHCGTQFNPIETNTQMGGQVPQQQVPAQGGMICPQCNSQVPAGNQFCNNCGHQLIENGMNKPVPSIAVQPQQNNQVKPEDMDKYYQAYFHNKYNEVVSSSFSIGTFFFGMLWLLMYKLYKEAGRLFLTIFIINAVASFLTTFFSFMGLRIPLFMLIGQIIILFICITYAKEFSGYRLARAERDIDRILSIYDDEEQRLRACKKAGNPNLIYIVVFLILALFVILIIISIFSSTFKTITNAKKDTVIDLSRKYADTLNTNIAADMVVPVKGKYNPYGSYYIIIDGSRNGTYNYPFNIKGATSEDKGYVLKDSIGYYVCLETKNGWKKAVVSGYVDEMARNSVDKKDKCNFNVDFPNSKAILLKKSNR